MQQKESVLIVGGGAAGHACAAMLRKEGFDGSVRVVDAEGDFPINRTLVDTGILPGLLEPAHIALPPLPHVELLRGRVVALEEAEKRVRLAGGQSLAADAVVLACGSAPRGLSASVSVAEGVQVHQLHGVSDAQALRAALPDPAGVRLVVVGSGFIGAEVASHYASEGARVTLLGRSALPLRAAVGDRIATHLASLHSTAVDARFEVALRSIELGEAGRGVDVTLVDGEKLQADAVVVALGSVPATSWLGRKDGICVDQTLRVPGVAGLYAAGGAARFDMGGESMRIDHWDDATAQGAHVARAVLHDMGIGADPGVYVPRAGFTLHVYGEVVAARGVRAHAGHEVDADAHLEPGLERGRKRERVLTEFTGPGGEFMGVVGLNAGGAVARRAKALGVNSLTDAV